MPPPTFDLLKDTILSAREAIVFCSSQQQKFGTTNVGLGSFQHILQGPLFGLPFNVCIFHLQFNYLIQHLHAQRSAYDNRCDSANSVSQIKETHVTGEFRMAFQNTFCYCTGRLCHCPHRLLNSEIGREIPAGIWATVEGHTLPLRLHKRLKCQHPHENGHKQTSRELSTSAYPQTSHTT